MMDRSTSDLHILDLLTRLVNELNIFQEEDIYPAQIFANLEAYPQIRASLMVILENFSIYGSDMEKLFLRMLGVG